MASQAQTQSVPDTSGSSAFQGRTKWQVEFSIANQPDGSPVIVSNIDDLVAGAEITEPFRTDLEASARFGIGAIDHAVYQAYRRGVHMKSDPTLAGTSSVDARADLVSTAAKVAQSLNEMQAARVDRPWMIEFSLKHSYDTDRDINKRKTSADWLIGLIAGRQCR